MLDVLFIICGVVIILLFAFLIDRISETMIAKKWARIEIKKEEYKKQIIVKDFL